MISLHGVRNKKITSHKEVSHTSQIISQSYRNMASESMMSEAITKAVAEATRVALQKMMETQAQRTQNAAGPKLGGPTLK